MVVAAAVEIVLLGVDQNRLWHAAREAARVAVVDDSADEVAAAVRRSGLDGVEISIDPEPAFRVQGRPLRVGLEYHPRGHVPLLGGLVRNFELTADATMRIESP